jgi:hypothetical protein
VRFDEKKTWAGYSPAQVGDAVIRGGLQQVGFLEHYNGALVRDNQHQQPANEQNCIHGFIPFFYD